MNPVAVGFDVALIGVSIFCFLVLGTLDRGSGVRRGYWAVDMRNAMIFMVVFRWVSPYLCLLNRRECTDQAGQHHTCRLYHLGCGGDHKYLLLNQQSPT